jgi:hypothetical protein
MMNFLVSGRYRLIKKIGDGAFGESTLHITKLKVLVVCHIALTLSPWFIGEVYLGVHIFNGREFAIKLERRETKHPQLLDEAHVYRMLASGVGVPYVKMSIRLSCLFFTDGQVGFFFPADLWNGVAEQAQQHIHTTLWWLNYSALAWKTCSTFANAGSV